MKAREIQRIQSVAWLLLGIGLIGTALFDVTRMSNEPAAAFAAAAVMGGVFLAYGVGALLFSRRLWSSRPAWRFVGNVVSVLGGIIGSLLVASNLTLGVLGRQPIYIVGAGLAAAFLWLCVASFRLNRALSGHVVVSR